MWQVRWAEDWSYLKDPSKRKSPFDPLKFIPLSESGDVYLTLNNELRVRSNTVTNPGLIPGSHSQQQYLFRAFFGADLHVGEHFRLYTELAHGSLDGRNEGAKTGTQENNAILQQVFFDVKGQVAETDLGLRVGRQVFVDGPTTLMALRDNTDIFVTFNGVRAWAIGEKTRVDVFDFNFNLDGTEGLGDDRIDRSRHFRGVVGAIACRQPSRCIWSRSSINFATTTRCGAARPPKKTAITTACGCGAMWASCAPIRS